MLFASYHGTVFDAGIPAETPDLASYRKRAVCEDWMVGAPALEPGTRRPLCATSGPPLYRRTADHASAFAPRAPAVKSLIRPCALEKRLQDVEHFIWLIVVKPVARALDLDQFGLLEMRDHAGRPGIG